MEGNWVGWFVSNPDDPDPQSLYAWLVTFEQATDGSFTGTGIRKWNGEEPTNLLPISGSYVEDSVRLTIIDWGVEMHFTGRFTTTEAVTGMMDVDKGTPLGSAGFRHPFWFVRRW